MKRSISVATLVAIGLLSLTGCQRAIGSSTELVNASGTGTTFGTGNFTAAATWGLLYDWDCSRAISEGKGLADGVTLTVVNADDGSAAYENPYVARTGRKGKGSLSFSRGGIYRVVASTRCLVNVRAYDTKTTGERYKNLDPQHGDQRLELAFNAQQAAGPCPNAATSTAAGTVCTHISGSALDPHFHMLTLALDRQVPASGGAPCTPSTIRGRLVDIDGDALSVVATGSTCVDAVVDTYTFGVKDGTASLWGAMGTGTLEFSSVNNSVTIKGIVSFP